MHRGVRIDTSGAHLRARGHRPYYGCCDRATAEDERDARSRIDDFADHEPIATVAMSPEEARAWSGGIPPGTLVNLATYAREAEERRAWLRSWARAHEGLEYLTPIEPPVLRVI